MIEGELEALNAIVGQVSVLSGDVESLRASFELASSEWSLSLLVLTWAGASIFGLLIWNLMRAMLWEKFFS
jgi:hypothetical protein